MIRWILQYFFLSLAGLFGARFDLVLLSYTYNMNEEVKSIMDAIDTVDTEVQSYSILGESRWYVNHLYLFLCYFFQSVELKCIRHYHGHPAHVFPGISLNCIAMNDHDKLDDNTCRRRGQRRCSIRDFDNEIRWDAAIGGIPTICLTPIHVEFFFRWARPQVPLVSILIVLCGQ